MNTVSGLTAFDLNSDYISNGFMTWKSSHQGTERDFWKPFYFCLEKDSEEYKKFLSAFEKSKLNQITVKGIKGLWKYVDKTHKNYQ